MSINYTPPPTVDTDTKNTPLETRANLETFTGADRLSGDKIKDGSTNKFSNDADRDTWLTTKGLQKQTYQSAIDPTVEFDGADTIGIGIFFRAGDWIFNTVTETLFFCQNAAAGAAVWDTPGFTNYFAANCCDFFIAAGNDLAVTNSSTYFLTLQLSQVKADGDTYQIYAPLLSGTYDIIVLGRKYSSRGKTDVRINGTTAGTIDWYSPVTVDSAEKIPNISIPKTKNQKIEIVVNGKNASSGGYSLTFSRLIIKPHYT